MVLIYIRNPKKNLVIGSEIEQQSALYQCNPPDSHWYFMKATYFEYPMAYLFLAQK